MVNKKEVMLNKGNVKVIFSGIKRNKNKIHYAYYEKMGYDKKGFLKDKEFYFIQRGSFDIINGEVFYDVHLCLRRRDNVRKAYLKVEDELRRRGWINIDEKLKEMKK